MTDELARGRVLHFNDHAWDALQDALAARNLTEMARHVAEQRTKDIVTLDLDAATVCVTALKKASECEQSVTTRLLIHSAIAKIEEQTQPQRIPEPGPWGVVEATWKPNDDGDVPEHRPFKSKFLNIGIAWRSIHDGFGVSWDELIDPVLIRPGIEDRQ